MEEIGPVELWRGVVNAWECDEMGHMNVRFYVAKAMEGLAVLARRLGKAHAFASRATATLAVREHHIRFLREARAGARLAMTGGVVELGASGATVVQVLRHEPGGELCATVVTRIEHVDAAEQRPFPWPERSRDAAARMRVAIPPQAAPRELLHAPDLQSATLARADALALPCHGLGAVMAETCDVFGRMRVEGVVAKMSEANGPPMEQVHDRLGVAAERRRIGAVALEFRIAYAGMPQAGDHLDIRSALTAVQPKVQRVAQWLLDPVTGRAWACGESILAAFDLDARKIVSVPPERVAALQDVVVPGLAARDPGDQPVRMAEAR